MKSNAVNLQCSGRFQLTVRRADGSVRKQTPWFDNLLLDQGMNRIGLGGAPHNFAMVGSGSSVATVGQTALDAQVASTSSVFGSNHTTNLVDGYASYTHTYRFAQGVAAGNLSEVGVGYTSTALFSRSRIVDGGGTPTTITVLADEFLDVTYEFRVYWPTTDVVGNIDISGVTYATVLRASRIGDWGGGAIFALFRTNGMTASTFPNHPSQAYGAGALGAITDGPGGVSVPSSNGGNTPAYAGVSGGYSNNSFQRNFSVQWNIVQAIAPIGNVELRIPIGYYKVSFDPVIPKDDTNQLTLNFTASWARRTI